MLFQFCDQSANVKILPVQRDDCERTAEVRLGEVTGLRREGATFPTLTTQPTLTKASRPMETGTKLVQHELEPAKQAFWAPITSPNHLLPDLKKYIINQKNPTGLHVSTHVSHVKPQ